MEKQKEQSLVEQEKEDTYHDIRIPLYTPQLRIEYGDLEGS